MTGALIKRFVSHSESRLQQACLIACLATFGFCGGCSRTPQPSDDDKRVLEILEEEYQLQGHEVDDRGRVIRLKLEGSQVDDAAIEYVRYFKMLRDLSLADASVSDAGIVKLQELKRLQFLVITGTRVTDRGLSYLQDIPSLRYVWVLPTGKLTARGIDSFKRGTTGINVLIMERAPQ